MLPKPLSCLGCPLYGDGHGYVPDALRDGPVAIVAQNPGAHEEEGKRLIGKDLGGDVWETCLPQPLIGATGHDMERRFMPLARLTRDDASLLNVLKCRWQPGGRRTNELPKGKELTAAVAHCRQHFILPSSVQVIVAMGGVAWEALGGPKGIMEWRGHAMPKGYEGRQVLATLHLADLYRDPTASLVTMRDWQKVPRLVRGEWPLPIPRAVNLHEEWHEWLPWMAKVKAPIAVDTEYNPVTKELFLIGLGYGDRVVQLPWNAVSSSRRAAFAYDFRHLAATVPFVFQNALADIPILRTHLGLTWKDYKHIDDTMQAHACLWSELPHDLGFLASLYGQYPKMKHLARIDPLLYNQGDVLETLSVWAALEKELAADPLTRHVYEEQHMRLLPILDESMQRGIRVNTGRVQEALVAYATKIDEAKAVAAAYCGWPINLSSDQQVGTWLYDIEGWKEKKKRRKSGEKAGQRSRTVDKDAVAEMRASVLPFDPEEAVTVEAITGRIGAGGHPLMEARVLHGHAAQCVENYLAPLVVEG